MPEEDDKSLEGWAPTVGKEVTLDRLIDLAFDYRGNVTLVKVDGTRVVGYIFNRSNHIPEPFIQMFDGKGDGPFKIMYSEIESIKFTGKDTAAGKSYAAWIRRKEQERGKSEAGTAKVIVPSSWQ